MMNKFKQLQVGQVVKNYKEMCKILEQEVVSGKSKQLQIKDWERYIKYTKQGHKFIIEEIYDEEIIKAETRGRKRIVIPLSESNPLLSSEWNVSKNGELTNNITRTTDKKYWWICHKCKTDIYEFPNNRFNKNKAPIFGFTDDCITCHYCNLSKGAKKIHDLLSKYDIDFVMEYTYKDLLSDKGNLLRFDFAIIKDNEVISLIEYDGEYHDFSEIVQYHDKIKDEYCKANNITLYRIHHTENPHNLASKYLLELCLISKDDYINEYDNSEINDLLNELEIHKANIVEIESKLRLLKSEVDVII
ncbi:MULTISPECIES: zinc-ribbon domain-containing protein [Lysinibacillus]|uniref:zinc-ribbon domain-containing protein n=1 Tax=Lysinibacillus TaxID=400634 RepID=UPI00214B0401|nr:MULTISPECIES: zinc-ribbon domain-containing protein [Lysinibacillus]UUV25832.1 zinc-ribbon domain-containing protein [Lysinibacillus sp. FN11]UYB48706.1 zinc-ribbon domain-containing protein [Lysinibacillus capsici]